ncbi:MAG: hypothetical protein KC776_00945 [Myxococcales bacterium]|nr:hypothetical protein [Myxococcales bacterium]MCB9582710.1 hypothetical protein [Polyangiaceae bacterium]
MPNPTPSELKKRLASDGFEIYRTTADAVQLADRVRDNLIMDSGVSAVVGGALSVRFITKAQASEFPGESGEQLFERARQLGAGAVSAGYGEVRTSVVPVHDPGDRARVLDTWYEVVFEKAVNDADLLDQLRYALSLPKSATR